MRTVEYGLVQIQTRSAVNTRTFGTDGGRRGTRRGARGGYARRIHGYVTKIEDGRVVQWSDGLSNIYRESQEVAKMSPRLSVTYSLVLSVHGYATLSIPSQMTANFMTVRYSSLYFGSLWMCKK